MALDVWPWLSTEGLMHINDSNKIFFTLLAVLFFGKSKLILKNIYSQSSVLNLYWILEDIFFLWDHWYPCFGLLVTSPLGFEAKVGSLICTWQRHMRCRFPEIHPWFDTCQLLDGQHGGRCRVPEWPPMKFWYFPWYKGQRAAYL